MSNLRHKEIFNKKQRTIWIIIVLVLGILTIKGLNYLFDINSTTEHRSKEVSKEKTNISSENNTNIKINFNELQGEYSGIKESLDGTIEAVFLQIDNINLSDYSFTFTINLGVNKKLVGTALYIPETNTIKSDIIGNLKCSINENDKIILLTSSDKSNSKYKLTKE